MTPCLILNSFQRRNTRISDDFIADRGRRVAEERHSKQLSATKYADFRRFHSRSGAEGGGGEASRFFGFLKARSSPRRFRLMNDGGVWKIVAIL
jgi:hypothetical protein